MAKLQVQRTFVYPYPYPHLWAKYCLRFSEATNNFLKNLSFFFQLFGDLTFSKQIFCLEKSIVNWHFSCSSVSKWLTFSEIFASSVNESVCNDLMGINKSYRERGTLGRLEPIHSNSFAANGQWRFCCACQAKLRCHCLLRNSLAITFVC